MTEFPVRGGRVARVLSVFDKRTKELAAEHPLAAFKLSEFRRHFGVPEADDDAEMVCEYAVGPADAGFIAGRLASRVDFDFANYLYFLSCHHAD